MFAAGRRRQRWTPFAAQPVAMDSHKSYFNDLLETGNIRPQVLYKTRVRTPGRATSLIQNAKSIKLTSLIHGGGIPRSCLSFPQGERHAARHIAAPFRGGGVTWHHF